MAQDEVELIGQSIQTLIKQIDLKDMCNDDIERFDYEMKNILLTVADNYRRSDLLERFNQLVESILSKKETLEC